MKGAGRDNIIQIRTCSIRPASWARQDLVPQTLASFEVFQGLALPALRGAHKAARVRRISTQTRVFNQGDPDVRAHALVEGIVRISQWGSDGAQTVKGAKKLRCKPIVIF